MRYIGTSDCIHMFVAVVICVMCAVGSMDIKEGVSAANEKRISNIKDWRGKFSYYFNSMDAKISETFEKSSLCSTRNNNIKLLPDYSVEVPTQSNVVNIAPFPPDPAIFRWWQEMAKPQQMRQEPLLCLEPYTKRKPIFEANGCQLPTYMHPSAPRCQSRILEEICVRSKMEKNNTSSNGFVLPEAHHVEMGFMPPTPFLITARNTFVTMCGQLIHRHCGLIHLSTSCLAQYQREQVMTAAIGWLYKVLMNHSNYGPMGTITGKID